MDLIILPKEMIQIEINKWLLEIDRQILRKVNKYFNSIFPFVSISFNNTDLQIPHLQRYRKYWSIFTCENLANSNNIECLKYIRDPKGDCSGEGACPWDEYTPALAAQNGHLECLKYAHTQGCKWDWRTTAWASRSGNLECLKYAHENSCQWGILTTRYASFYKHLECLKYARDPKGDGSRENGCPEQ